jgi:non-heme chloroperoxidase
MPTITTIDGTEIYYKDWGKGQPIVFSHGWPLSADDWDTQMMFFVKQGYRVIALDRRGHGRSSQTDSGHDMDQETRTHGTCLSPKDRFGPIQHSRIS